MTTYPPVGFYFQVGSAQSGGKDLIAFQEVSGLSAELNLATDIDTGIRRVPSPVTYSNIVLKRGLAPSNSTFIKWIVNTLSNDFSQKISPKDLNVFLADGGGTPLKTWIFKNAWPVKWEISEFQSPKDEIVIQSLEFAYSYFEVIT